MSTKFGRNMPGYAYWYDTKNTNILRERYGRENSQRGFGLDGNVDLERLPSEQLSRMYPTPHKALPPWATREDMDSVNRTIAVEKYGSKIQNFGRSEVTPKVGDTASLPRSSLRVQKLEDARYSGFMDIYKSPKGLYKSQQLISDPVTAKMYADRATDTVRPPTADKHPMFSATSGAAMMQVTPAEWKNIKLRPLETACHTTSGAAFVDPAPYLSIAGADKPNRDKFKKRTERSQFHEAIMIQNRLAPEK